MPAFAVCDLEQVELRGTWGSARFDVEIADDPDERAIGLMNRASMPRQSGMLFVYEEPQSVAFWMRNTLIPLDLIFIDQTGIVTRVHQNAIPLDETSIPGGRGVLAVLEVNGGLSEVLGIAPGSEVRHPAFKNNDPSWPCD
ncbi:DUF192 domain-containing protein [Pseudoruegeria sp. SK021]|uniref:DUF192 domain-containing protein n=1 Tax=Pseudoruegeria sp. SK021 TaxID=1933035 RepID=UPI001F0B5423|nr:DUF192 domain-containing protein [Pseudoruegeria sp. SK021]